MAQTLFQGSLAYLLHLMPEEVPSCQYSCSDFRDPIPYWALFYPCTPFHMAPADLVI